METIRLTGSDRIQAEVVDTYEHQDGTITGTAIINGERVPVVLYNWWEYFYLDMGEIVR